MRSHLLSTAVMPSRTPIVWESIRAATISRSSSTPASTCSRSPVFANSRLTAWRSMSYRSATGRLPSVKPLSSRMFAWLSRALRTSHSM